MGQETLRQQHRVECPLSNTRSHAHNNLGLNSNKSFAHQQRGRALDRGRAAGQGLDTLAEGRADLRQRY